MSTNNKINTVNGAKQAVNGASVVRRDPVPALTKTMKSRNTKELLPLEELKVLPSDEGFSWANENYNSWLRCKTASWLRESVLQLGPTFIKLFTMNLWTSLHNCRIRSLPSRQRKQEVFLRVNYVLPLM